jgi:hypothetical protein
VPALHPEVISEIEGIPDELEADQNHIIRESWFRAIRELLTVKANQQSLLFVISGQVLSQWSGANSITSM